MTASPSLTTAAKPSYDVIVMSASAGGLEAVTSILSNLPAHFPVPIIVVLHHAEGGSKALARLLARWTRLSVVEATDGARLAAGTVYLAPPTRHVQLMPDYTIASTNGRRINYLRSSSDPLLTSLASICGPRAIALVLSGTGRNGALGAKALHDAGGLVFAQDEATSRNFGMPGAAIAAGAVNAVLPLEAIASRLIELTRPREQ